MKGEDLPDDTASEKSSDLVSYARAQDKTGDPINLDDLQGLIDEDRQKTFAEFIRAGKYRISESFAPDKRTLNRYRLYTGRAEGMSVSFEENLLGTRVEFDAERICLILKNLPTQLINQLKLNQ